MNLFNWVITSVMRQQRKKAFEVLKKARKQEINKKAPIGKKWIWIKGPLRTRKRVLVDKDYKYKEDGNKNNNK